MCFYIQNYPHAGNDEALLACFSLACNVYVNGGTHVLIAHVVLSISSQLRTLRKGEDIYTAARCSTDVCTFSVQTKYCWAVVVDDEVLTAARPD